MANKNPRAIRWCFTLNNYTDDEVKALKKLQDVEYMIFGYEEAPTTGTKHLQGFMVFTERKYMSWIIGKLDERIHLEVAKGSIEQNRVYCSKTGRFEEFGVPPLEQWEAANKANQNKWDSARQAAKRGRFEEIPSDLWLKYRKAFEQEYQDEQINKQVPFDNLRDHFLWIWGKPGTGKSYVAREIAKELFDGDPFLKQVNKWWTGYRGQSVVIIEEIQPDLPNPLIGMLKQWFDKWEFACETKGGQFNKIRPPYIIVTSNYSIDDVFTNPVDCEAMKRRIFEWHKTSKDQRIHWPTQRELEVSDPDPTLIELEPTQALGRRADVDGNTRGHPRQSTDVDLSPRIHDYPSSQEY